MTSRLTKTVAATVATAALLTFPLSAFGAVSQPTLSEAAVSSMHAPRGSVVSAVPVAQLTAAQLDAASADFPGTPPAAYGVTAYRLIYRTIDHNGRPTTASGIVVLPDGRRGALTVARVLARNQPDEGRGGVGGRHVDRSAGHGSVRGSGAGRRYSGLPRTRARSGQAAVPRHQDRDDLVGRLLLAARTFAAKHGVALKRDVLVTRLLAGRARVDGPRPGVEPR